MWRCCVLLLAASAHGKLNSEPEDNDTGESGGAWGKIEMEEDYIDVPVKDDSDDRDRLDEDSTERIGASVTQISKFPFAATLLLHNEYICSGVILNTNWIVTETKCFHASIISSYVTHRNLKNYTVRVGSSYNNKGGSLYKITTLINNFDLKVTVVKLASELEFDDNVQSAKLPEYEKEVALGYLASIVAWTPVGHMRVVNAPLLESSICESYTKLLPGHYICVGGVTDINRKFCRKDNGGAVVQNDTLIGISSFLHPCALYTRTHAFPKVSSFARWIDSVIWDDGKRPTTKPPVVTTPLTTQAVNNTQSPDDSRTPYFGDPRKFMLTLPFDPINVPLEPSGDNSVIPRMSLYESYLQSKARSKTSTTIDPEKERQDLEDKKRDGLKMQWMKKYGNAVMMMPPQMYQGKRYGYNEYK